MSSKIRYLLAGLSLGAVLGIFVAVVFDIPRCFRFSVRASSRSEQAIILEEIFKAQVSYFEEHGKYAGGEDCFDLLRLGPCGTNRYSYYCGADVINNSWGGDCPLPDVPHGVTDNSFTAMAVGNIDSDPECDVWTMNDAKVLKNMARD